jgi:hypothetical protein
MKDYEILRISDAENGYKKIFAKMPFREGYKLETFYIKKELLDEEADEK